MTDTPNPSEQSPPTPDAPPPDAEPAPLPEQSPFERPNIDYGEKGLKPQRKAAECGRHPQDAPTY